MKLLAAAAADYLALRRALGFKLRHQTWWLPDFVSYLEAHGSSVITTKLALDWAQTPRDASPKYWADRLGAVRQFARHHRAFDPRTEVPPLDLLPRPRAQRLIAYIYTDDEVAALIRAASRLQRRLPSATYPTLLGLLAATGMRVSEALALHADDIDWNRKWLTVRCSKFSKSRHVPLHETTLGALRDYARVRDRLRPHRRSPSFFLSNLGTQVVHQTFWRVFQRLLKRTGIGGASGRRPRIHDLRHAFAMKVLRDWYAAGVDVEPRLPWLATYLGHVSPSTTYWYLRATPELLALAGERAERAWKVRP